MSRPGGSGDGSGYILALALVLVLMYGGERRKARRTQLERRLRQQWLLFRERRRAAERRYGFDRRARVVMTYQ
jgi:hypothetical protein